MSGPIPTQQLADVRAHILVSLIAARDKPDPQMCHLLVSISEYLKDAERWHYAKHNLLPILPPDQLEKFVDEELKK